MVTRRVLANLLCTEHSNGLEELRGLASHSPVTVVREVVDTAKATIKEKNTAPSVKLRALLALDVCVQAGSTELVVYAGKKVLPRLSRLALTRNELSDEMRGATLFGTWNEKETAASVEFLSTLLDCIQTWARIHPTLEGTESLYRKIYLKLFPKVTFPPSNTSEDEELLQTQQEIQLARNLLETTSTRAQMTPVMTSLKEKLVLLERSMMQPSKRVRQMLNASKSLQETLERFYERYPEERVEKEIPGYLEPIAEPTPLPPPKCNPRTSQPLTQLDLDSLFEIIKKQEFIIEQQKAEIHSLQTQLRLQPASLMQSIDSFRTKRNEISPLHSLNSSFTTRENQIEDLAYDSEIVNIEQAKSGLLRQKGLLYDGSLRCQYEWTGYRCAVLKVTNCMNEVLSQVTVVSLEAIVECKGHSEQLRPYRDADFQVRILTCKATSWLASLRINYQGSMGMISLCIALPVGPLQAVTRRDRKPSECAEIWKELKPFQTVRRFNTLRRDLKSMHAVAGVVSCQGSFQVLSCADWPALGKNALLLHAEVGEKPVLVCVSIGENSSHTLAIRLANVRLREALASALEASLVAVP